MAPGVRGHAALFGGAGRATACRSGWPPAPSSPPSSSSSTVNGRTRWAAAPRARPCWPWPAAWPPAPWCRSRSRKSSTSGCPRADTDVPRSHRLRPLAGGLHDAGVDLLRAGLHAGRRGDRRAAGPHRHHGRGLDDHADAEAAVGPGAAGADLHLRRRDLRRQPQRHPAEHPRHAGLGGVVPGRLRAGPPGHGGPRDGHRHQRLGAGHADRHVLPGAVHAGAGRGGAEVRRLRVLLAGGVRRHHLRDADRRRCAQGLDRRLRGPVHRHHRPGRHPRLRALQLRQPRPGRRHFAGAGAGRRLRLRRDPGGHAGAAAAGEDQRARLGDPEAAGTCSSTGAPSCARA